MKNKKPSSKSEKLSKKELGFVRDYVKTGNGTKSALNNYNTKDESVGAVIASENLRKPKIQKAILSIAEQIPDKLLIEKHLKLLNKTEVVTRNNVSTGEIEILPTGEIDAQAVKAGLDMAYKLKGVYAPEKRALTDSQGNDLTQEQIDKLNMFFD